MVLKRVSSLLVFAMRAVLEIILVVGRERRVWIQGSAKSGCDRSARGCDIAAEG